MLSVLPQGIDQKLAIKWLNDGNEVTKGLLKELLTHNEPVAGVIPIQIEKPLLFLVDTVLVAATKTSFIARDHLVVNTELSVHNLILVI